MATIIKGKNARKPWTVRYMAQGRQREKSFVTKKEAGDYAALVEHDKRAQVFIDPKLGDVAFRDYAATWIAQHAGAANSIRIYKSTLANHINPVVGDVPLRKISRDQLRALLLETLPAKPVSRSVVVTSRLIITAVLSEAVKSKRITENPAAGIRLQAAVDAAEFYVPTRAELEATVAAMPGDWRLAVWLMRGCGLRIAEALAVTADSLKGDYIRITGQVLAVAPYTGPLKHRKPGEFRDVPLPRWVAAKVEKHLVTYPPAGDGHLFPRRNMESFRDSFARKAALAGLPESFTPHDLRHVFASAALAGGVPVTDVSRYLGHKNINLTYATYSHWIPSSLDTARAVLDADWDAGQDATAVDTKRLVGTTGNDKI